MSKAIEQGKSREDIEHILYLIKMRLSLNHRDFHYYNDMLVK